jgi:tetratricopeptide (TPR) repeat protein
MHFRLRFAWIALGAAALVVCGAHVALDASAVFGIWRPVTNPARFYAPFVNPNHFAAFLLVPFPVAVTMAMGRGRTKHRLLAMVVGVACATGILWVAAAGPMLILGLQLLALAWVRWWPIGTVATLASPLAVAYALQRASDHGSDVMASWGGRVEAWGAAVRATWAHPVFGHGIGSFERAVGPHRTDHDFRRWAVAHNDPLQWVVETGLIGALFMVIAAMAIGTSVRRPVRRWDVAIGVGGVAAYSLVDFPFQLPVFVLLACVGAAQLTPRSRGVHGFEWRLLAFILGALQVLCIVLQIRRIWVSELAGRLDESASDEAARAQLAWLAPQHPVLSLAEIRAPVGRRSPELLIHHMELHWSKVEVQTAVCRRAARDRHLEVATEACERAVKLAPWDYRTWKLRAMVAILRDGQDGVSAWRDAVLAGVPSALDDGWRLLPVGLYWLDAFEEEPANRLAWLGNFLLQKGEREVAVMAFESAKRRDPSLLMRPYVDELVRRKEWAQLDRHLADAIPSERDRMWVLERRAVAAEGLGRWEEARDLWLHLAQERGGGLGRAVLAQSQVGGPDSAEALWRGEVLAGRQVSTEDWLGLAAVLHAKGADAECQLVLREHSLLSHPALKVQASNLKRLCDE